MTASYEGNRSGLRRAHDAIATVCASYDPAAMADSDAYEDLAVPVALLP